MTVRASTRRLRIMPCSRWHLRAVTSHDLRCRSWLVTARRCQRRQVIIRKRRVDARAGINFDGWRAYERSSHRPLQHRIAGAALRSWPAACVPARPGTAGSRSLRFRPLQWAAAKVSAVKVERPPQWTPSRILHGKEIAWRYVHRHTCFSSVMTLAYMDHFTKTLSARQDPSSNMLVAGCSHLGAALRLAHPERPRDRWHTGDLR